MNEIEIKKNSKEFADYWKDKGYEKGESQKFWLSFLNKILGIKDPEKFITFEDQVKLDHTSFIDGFIPSTHVLIEQKGRDKDLRKAIKQSDNTLLTPFQQAKRYSSELSYSQRPRWIITCNFQEFLIYDMEKPNCEPESILLKDLPKEYYRFQFIVNNENENIKKEMEISIKAGEIVGKLYDALLKQYNDKNEKELKSLNELCVRLVFCLYAEDSGLFGERLAFHNYLQSLSVRDTRRGLIDLFKVLDTKICDRDKYLDDDLSKFPYVNGGLFANENIIIPQFTQEIVDILLHKASEDFDWSEISPTIFGAVFESTLNPETRRSGGMHYTSIENIHKVIDPLFLNNLKSELENIKETKVEKIKKQQLEAYIDKLSQLNFLDPACGSGNFLTETYISLRKLENEALILKIDADKNIADNQIVMGLDNVIKVSIKQFYGIEINDFAVTVAKTALWISESQMMKETEMIVNRTLDFFPLKSYVNIVEANALRIDWNQIVPKEKLNYIMGNPPFVGGKLMDSEQKKDAVNIFGNISLANSLDYVCAWYFKAQNMINNSKIKCAFVSTNSICQGLQATALWKPLFEKGIVINFAYKTFIWNSEAKDKAKVHCVIIGFSQSDFENKIIYENGTLRMVKNINQYLLNAPSIFIEKTSKPICNVNELTYGNMPIDDGNFILDENDKNSLISQTVELKPFIKKYIGAQEFINNSYRWCLWLKDASPRIYRNNNEIMKRLEKIKEFREKSTSEATRKSAKEPYKFFFSPHSNFNYLLIPRVSSEKRKYIPIGFITPDTIASDACSIIPNSSIYDFGILTSNVHNSWMRIVGGRLKSDYRYSGSVVYNTFPWPTPTKELKDKIERTAQQILDARNLYPDCSLADLYDETTMPPELRKAHQENDKAVMEAYGFWGKIKTESECVAELMKMYQTLTEKN